MSGLRRGARNVSKAATGEGGTSCSASGEIAIARLREVMVSLGPAANAYKDVLTRLALVQELIRIEARYDTSQIRQVHLNSLDQR